MAATPSTMLELGTQAPPFDLPDTNARTGAPRVTDREYQDKPLLVAFICNHCPFVLLVKDRFSELAAKWENQGLAVVAISSNDIDSHPDDAPDKMTGFASQGNFDFPYLYDESQAVARAYKAACTPDFFLFDDQHRLVYRGQFDDARPGNGIEVTGADLDAAVQALLGGESVAQQQKPSMGCNIKWKPGNEPDYF